MGIACALCLFASAVLVPADTFRIDPDASRLAFTIQHLGFNTVRGSFEEFDGELVYTDDPESLRLSGSVQVASIDTGIGLRDRHLRGADWFDAGRHPRITFRQGQLTGMRSDGRGTIEGVLSIRGTSRPVALNAQLEERAEEGEVVLTIDGAVDHRPFGVVPDSAGGRTIGDTVTADIRLVARRGGRP